MIKIQENSEVVRNNFNETLKPSFEELGHNTWFMEKFDSVFDDSGNPFPSFDLNRDDTLGKHPMFIPFEAMVFVSNQVKEGKIPDVELLKEVIKNSLDAMFENSSLAGNSVNIDEKSLGTYKRNINELNNYSTSDTKYINWCNKVHNDFIKRNMNWQRVGMSLVTNRDIDMDDLLVDANRFLNSSMEIKIRVLEDNQDLQASLLEAYSGWLEDNWSDELNGNTKEKGDGVLKIENLDVNDKLAEVMIEFEDYLPLNQQGFELVLRDLLDDDFKTADDFSKYVKSTVNKFRKEYEIDPNITTTFGYRLLIAMSLHIEKFANEVSNGKIHGAKNLDGDLNSVANGLKESYLNNLDYDINLAVYEYAKYLKTFAEFDGRFDKEDI